jgi:hypothetical protein
MLKQHPIFYANENVQQFDSKIILDSAHYFDRLVRIQQRYEVEKDRT